MGEGALTGLSNAAEEGRSADRPSPERAGKLAKSVAILGAALWCAWPPPALARDRQGTEHGQPGETGDDQSSDWRLYVSSGLTYSTRKLDGQRTDYYRTPLTARIANGRLRLSASIPYLIVQGPSNLRGDSDEEVDDDSSVPGSRSTRKGFGDLSLSARYRLGAWSSSGFELDVLGRVKLPTGSKRKRLTSGKTDFALGGELSRKFGKVEPFASLQYRINGDPPGRDYRNSIATSLGASTRLGRKSRASLSYDYSQSRVRGLSGAHALEAGVTTRLTRGLSLGGLGELGLSHRAPDFRIGSTITARLF